jgi:hypothetical protein
MPLLFHTGNDQPRENSPNKTWLHGDVTQVYAHHRKVLYCRCRPVEDSLMSEFRLTVESTYRNDDGPGRVVSEGLRTYNDRMLGDGNRQQVAVYIRHDDQIIGGLLGETRWSWLDCILSVLLHLLLQQPGTPVELCPECHRVFFRQGRQLFCGRKCTNRAMTNRKRTRDREREDARNRSGRRRQKTAPVRRSKLR